jgi:hypothetical protein
MKNCCELTIKAAHISNGREGKRRKILQFYSDTADLKRYGFARHGSTYL